MPTPAAAAPAPIAPIAPVAPIEPVAITATGLVCAAGLGVGALLGALRDGRSALAASDDPQLGDAIGRVAAADDAPLPPRLAALDSRATRLAWLGLQADDFAAAVARAVRRCGAARVGIVVGTSASTIAVSEAAYRELDAAGAFAARWRRRDLNAMHAVTEFARAALGVAGPALTVSTACSSSAKAFAVAERWLRLALADAVVVGGVDALGDSLRHGFHALGLLSSRPCRPFAADRDGISIGEAAGWALVERRGEGAWRLVGHGEASDAHHLSAPHPDAAGADAALAAALARAGIDVAAVDHVNLHATATPLNDAVEAALVARRYADGVAAAATKGVTGHTMGAAGIVEAIACGLAIEHQLAFGSVGTDAVDPALGATFARQLRRDTAPHRIRVAASHAFGFGGSNAVLLFAPA